jgi:HlyD family secretion protein
MKMKNQRKWMIGVLAVMLLASGCQSPASATPGGPLTASGMIQADEIYIASELGGRIVQVQAKMGTEVRAGDVLATLDPTQLLGKLAEAETSVATAQADLAVVQAGPRPEEIAAAQATLALAQAQRDGAYIAWQDAVEAVKNPQDLDAQITSAHAKVNLAAQSVELAKAQLAHDQMVLDQKPESDKDITDLQLKASQEALAAAQANQKAAQTALDQLLSIRSKPLGLIAQANAAQGQYRIAEENVAVAQARLDDLLAGPTPEQVAVAEAAVCMAQAQANVLKTQQAKFTLTSPVDGVVLDQALHIGEVAAPAATILTVADLHELTLVVYVPENQIGQVHLGQTAQVSVDSFPGQSFTGQVKRIGNQPEFTPRNVATKEERLNTFYAVEIRLPNAQGLLKPGMPADATL